ncbi:unnamed protein product [Rhizophagus irregularis]|nr:unnamed protein product [Rhizophagus irregularis]CAB4420668.1 unnamed protein product [Rhizophagus irregularis]
MVLARPFTFDRYQRDSSLWIGITNCVDFTKSYFIFEQIVSGYQRVPSRIDKTLHGIGETLSRIGETLSLFLKRTCDTLSNLGSVAESKARFLLYLTHTFNLLN